MTFEYEKPAGFSYKAGQFADYTLIDPSDTDEEGSTRGFSLSSAPYEPNPMCTTRMRDTAFKRVRKDMPIGTELELDAPYGSFTLHNKIARPAVFLTGGIGITPVRSIALQSLHDRTGPRRKGPPGGDTPAPAGLHVDGSDLTPLVRPGTVKGTVPVPGQPAVGQAADRSSTPTIAVSMAAFPSKLNRSPSFGGQGSDFTYRGELTRTALRRAALVYGEPVTAARAHVGGGNPHDVPGAHAAGIACVGVASLCFTAVQFLGAGADYVIASPTGGPPLEGKEVTA